MDFSFIDNYKTETPPTSTEAQTEGFQKLVEVAQNIPLLTWNYNGVDVPDTGTKIGIITQALQKVDGLASMVQTDENGVSSYDSALLSGAALGLVAELARYVLNIKLRDDYATEVNNDTRTDIPTENTNSTTAADDSNLI